MASLRRGLLKGDLGALAACVLGLHLACWRSGHELCALTARRREVGGSWSPLSRPRGAVRGREIPLGVQLRHSPQCWARARAQLLSSG